MPAIVGAVAWGALLLQLGLSVRLSLSSGDGVAHGIAVYLGYFTVLTNLLVAVIALRAATRRDGGRDLPWRGCAVTAIAVVGLGYHLLLRDVWDPRGWQQVADIALHYAVPLATLLWWVGAPPSVRVTASAPLRWMAWPVAYAVYALLCGAATGRYPYYFIDVGVLGHARVAAHLIALLAVFVLTGYAMRAVANAGIRRSRSVAKN